MSGIASVLQGAGKLAYQLAMEISPILLTGQSQLVQSQAFSWSPVGAVPIVLLTEGPNLLTGLLAAGAQQLSLDRFFMHFRPLPGTELIAQDIGLYPFANNSVAANATMQKPLRISYVGICPVQHAGGHTAKFATFLLLKAALDQHNQTGGTYTLVTPTYLYQNCIMTGIRDVSGGESKYAQYAWEFDFIKPIVSLSAASVQNDLMNRLTGGQQTTGATSGTAAPGLTGTSGLLTGPV
jgi:hypothetical protein